MGVLKVFAMLLAAHEHQREPAQEAVGFSQGLCRPSVNIHNMLFVCSGLSAAECPVCTHWTIAFLCQYFPERI